MKLIHRVVVAVLIFFVPFLAQAENPLTPDLQGAERVYIDQGDGLIASLPNFEHADLLQRITSLRGKLKHHENLCSERVEAARFSTKDVLITIIMPGGLLYAASRKKELITAQTQLAQTTHRLHELEDDLYRLNSVSAIEALAYLGQP